MKLHLTDFDSNTYEDTDGSCELCMYTGMLDHPLYTFTDNYGGVHTIEGWWFDWGHLITINVNLPVFTSWLHSVEFKEPGEVAEYLCAGHCDAKSLWDEYLHSILTNAQWCSTPEELNENLDWALKGENNAD